LNIKYNLYLYIYIVITNIKKYKWKSFILITNQQQKRLKMSKKTMQYNKAFVSIFYLHHFATLFYSIHNTIIQKKNGWRSFHFSTSSYLVFCIEYTKNRVKLYFKFIVNLHHCSLQCCQKHVTLKSFLHLNTTKEFYYLKTYTWFHIHQTYHT